MIYRSIRYKNGVIRGCLTFSTGKRVFLNTDEQKEFLNKIAYWEDVAIEKYKEEYAKSEKMGWGMK